MTKQNRSLRYATYKKIIETPVNPSVPMQEKTKQGAIKAMAYMESRWPYEFTIKEEESKSKGKK